MKQSSLSRFLQSRVFMVVVRLAPWSVSFYFLWLLTSLYFLLHREKREIIRKNIEEVFAKTRGQEEIGTIFRSTLRGIFHHYFEKLFLACSTNQQWKQYLLESIRVSGKRLLDQRLMEMRGVILVTPHFGAVEFLPGFLTLLGYPVAIVAKFKTQRLRDKCEKRARSVGARIIDANRKNSFLSALSALGEGKILITQCDEVECWKPHRGKSIPLFGTSFLVDRTLPILQKRSGASVVFGYVRREGRGRYTAEIEDLPRLDGAMSQRLTETILKRFEKLVYTYPDQWYIWRNFHLMKAPAEEEAAVEDRSSRNLPITPPFISTYQPSHSFSQLHGEYCCQASV